MAKEESIELLKPDPANPRVMKPEAATGLGVSMETFDDIAGITWNERTGEFVAGHQRMAQLRAAGAKTWRRLSKTRGMIAHPKTGAEFPIRIVDWDPSKQRAANLVANNPHLQGEYTPEALAQLKAIDDDVDYAGLRLDALQATLEAGLPEPEAAPGTGAGALAERFGIPPFSVLDARQGYWQDRKRAWLALGIKSELGRGDAIIAGGTSEDGGASPWAGNRGGKRASPGGSPRPAASLGRDGKTVRGDGKGRGLARTSGQDLMRGEHVVGQNRLTWVAGARDPDALDDTSRKILEAQPQSGTSIFDPVLCELAYSWFSPPGGVILDPFAGGSVRGIVAAKLGRQYVGIELRPEQVEANREQGRSILSRPGVQPSSLPTIDHDRAGDVTDPAALTPVVRARMPSGARVWIKRDDAFVLNGVRGSKARAGRILAQGAAGFVTAGNRHSPMVSRTARLAEAAGIPCRVWTAKSKSWTDQEIDAKAHGAEVIKGDVTYLAPLQTKARADAKRRGWRFLELGLESFDYIAANRPQAANLPPDARRIVVAVGSGTGLAAILHGLDDAGRSSVPVLGVCIGKDPSKVLDRHAPAGWRKRVRLVPSGMDYEARVPFDAIDGVPCDPYYEGKLAAFAEEGDCLYFLARRSVDAGAPGAGAPSLPTVIAAPMPVWHVADARELAKVLPADFAADLVFSCPPYADLEVYSDDPRDLSTMDYPAFVEAYRQIIAAAVGRLRDDRFACFCVGDVRDKKGFYRGFVSETIAAFEAAGARLYNEAVLVTAVGSLPLRTGKQFETSRKLGKTHQNVLVFCKGDPRRAADAGGRIAMDLPLSAIPLEQDPAASLQSGNG